MDIKYISMGLDCSPASAMKDLGLRNCSLPLDWVDSTQARIENCLIDKFKNME